MQNISKGKLESKFVSGNLFKVTSVRFVQKELPTFKVTSAMLVEVQALPKITRGASFRTDSTCVTHGLVFLILTIIIFEYRHYVHEHSVRAFVEIPVMEKELSTVPNITEMFACWWESPCEFMHSLDAK